jgi:hypothetical protein
MDLYTWNEDGIWGVLNDDLRVRVGRAQGTGRMWIGVDARLWDDRPDQANYSHDDLNTYAPDEITIDGEGLLTALHRHETARVVDYRQGFTLRLPLAFVEPLRGALTELTKALTSPVT